jgi:hypothetical protein
MRLLGILLALAGWLIPVLALSFTQALGPRFGACLVGIAISLVGILVVLNGFHQQDAIWKKS